MAPDENICPIWGGEFEAQIQTSEFRDERIVDCRRCGGGYRIDLAADIGVLSLEERARLTTWLVDQRVQGVKIPTILERVIEYVKNRPPLQVHERANRLLRLIANQTSTVGTTYSVRGEVDPAAYAWSESTTVGEIGYFVDYLVKKRMAGLKAYDSDEVSWGLRNPRYRQSHC